MLGRVILFTLILGGTVALNLVWGTPEELGGPYVRFLFVFIAAIYVLNIVYGLLFRWVSRLVLLALVQLAGDLLTGAILVHFTGGAESAFVLIFLLAPIAAALTVSRRATMLVAAMAVSLFVVVALLGFLRWLPLLPGQLQLPSDVTPGALGRSLLINVSAMVAVAVLAAYLAEQLRSAAARVEVQQAHIDDLATLNTDIIRCLTSGLITVTNEGRVISINRAAGEMLSLPHGQAVGRPLASFCPELDRCARGGDMELPGGMRRTELEIQRGRRLQLLGISVSPLTDHLNQVRGCIINFQDLTAIRQMEQTVKRSEHLASLGRMAAAIAHEIRNPLASISGSLELLHSDESAPENRKLMEIALREIDRLNRLITSFLAYARPAPPQRERMDLGRELPLLTEGMAASDTPRLEVEAEPGLWVEADRSQLRAVLWNLVRNACEAGEQERILIRAASSPPHHVVLEVADHASGIPAHSVDQIFEPFFTTKPDGTGLGLATVHRMVHDNDGTIQVRSKEDQGTTFIVTLPRVAPGSNGS